jgi:hypothetical protein
VGSTGQSLTVPLRAVLNPESHEGGGEVTAVWTRSLSELQVNRLAKAHHLIWNLTVSQH